MRGKLWVSIKERPKIQSERRKELTEKKPEAKPRRRNPEKTTKETEPKISEETSRAKQSKNTQKKYTERRVERQKGIRDQPCHHLHPCTRKINPKQSQEQKKTEHVRARRKKEKQTERRLETEIKKKKKKQEEPETGDTQAKTREKERTAFEKTKGDALDLFFGGSNFSSHFCYFLRRDEHKQRASTVTRTIVAAAFGVSRAR
ncbi:hypothetical protein NC653_038291 [Populus alba x Populus x berolinensis]|uniref:Uncharacterized protein n=1 Tax=Populus alba x Populus x berolinensis TaxID=444605 RepID=A0AAD6PUM9_9ROSI|nr:hypothetical protein NC653_038291 [Populus alba x Populus x berolinensis]